MTLKLQTLNLGYLIVIILEQETLEFNVDIQLLLTRT